jgi:hypothetical protein
MRQAIQCTGYNPHSFAVSCALPPQAEKSAGSERPWGEGVSIDFVSKLPTRPRTANEVEQTYGRPAFRAGPERPSRPARPEQSQHAPAPERQPGDAKGAVTTAQHPVMKAAAANTATAALRDSGTSHSTVTAAATDVPIAKSAKLASAAAAASADHASKDAVPVQVTRLGSGLNYYFGARLFNGFGPRASFSTYADGSPSKVSLIFALHSNLSQGFGAGITVPMASIKVGACTSKVSMNGMLQMSAVIANLSFSPDCLSLSTSWEQADVANFRLRGWLGAVYTAPAREIPAWLAELPGVSTVLEKLNGAAGVKSSRAQ